MHVAVVGAGFAGLVTAKTLTDFGHQVTVFELSSEVGGVWSRERRYPGVRTQNSKQTYCLSSLLMPKKLDDHPEGAQVQAYLETFVDKELDRSRIKLETEVVKALPEEKGWRITVRPHSRLRNGQVDHPERCRPEPRAASSRRRTSTTSASAPGLSAEGRFPHFRAAPSSRLPAGAFSTRRTSATSMSSAARCVVLRLPLFAADSRHVMQNVVVVGYGKSACDSAQAIQAVAQTTHVAARSIIWKLPTWLAGLHYSYLLLTRFVRGLSNFVPLFSPTLYSGRGPVRVL